MNFLKIIFLLGLFINDSYASTFVDFHSHLPTLSWRQHWLEALGKMEGTSGALSKEYRQDLLQRFFAGFGKNPRKDAEASLREAVTESGRVASDLNTKRYLVFDNFVRRWKDSPYISATTNMDEILESGLIPISSQYSHNARDRRWTAGWLLDVMDIIRQQGFLQPAFHAPFDDVYNNDLLKVRELSGTFWKWNGNPAEINQAKELFSGMIQPSQNIKGGSDNPNTTVNIISCFQGLWNQRMEEIYFLPKGEAPTPNNFFRVVSIKVGDGRFLDQDEVDIVSQRWNEDEWGELFQEDDYAIIKVQNLSKSGGKTLRNILQDKNLLSGNRVITLQGDLDSDFEPDHIFAYGKPNANLKLDEFDANGFCIVSDVSTGNAVEELEAHFESKSSPLLIEPLHKLKDPTKVYNVDAKTDDVSPKITRLKAAVYALPLPLTQGMNGGPVLMCKTYKTSSLSQIKCQLIGVIHGSGLIQDPDHKVNYKGLISLSPQILRGGYSYEPWENIHANLVQMSWNTHWQEAMAKMEGTTSDLEAEQQTMVLERFAKGRGRTPNLDLVADLDQSKNPDAGMQVAPPLKKDYLNNKLYPANVDMKKVLKTGMLQIPRRDRRIAAAVILSTMDIARQQPFTQKLFHISSHNPKKNDLASVKKLSGTFWSWDPSKNIRFATERFSGMIQTAQDATKDTFNIISCVHGIEKMDLRHVYFLPKGKSPTSNNFFQVQSFQVGGDYAAILNTTTGVTSTVDDYAIIQVNNAAVSGPNTLKNILETEDMLEGSNVIAFQGESTRTDFTPDRVFAYGKPGVNFLKEAASEENGFCLVSDVFDGNMVDELEDQSEVVFQDNPLRKLVVPEEIHQVFPVPRTVPRTKDTQLLSKNQQAIPVFNYPGMSGGPILACQIEDTARVPQIKCVHFGVVSGSSLIRETDGKIFERGLIALPRSKHNRH